MKGSKEGNLQNRRRRSRTDMCRALTQSALQVCDGLEALADQLPKQSISDWRATQRQCKTLLYPYFSVLNDVVLPKMLLQSVDRNDRSDLLARCRVDCQDQLHALSELDAMITDVLMADRLSNEPEALGFALRSFFETLRRDLRWQFALLWPLADRTWSTKDADQILQSFEQLNEPPFS